MVNRSLQHRRERVADALRDEMVAILEGELNDPRIGLATVSEVLLAPNGKSARIYIQAEGSPQEQKETMAGLNAAKGFIRHQVLSRLGLRRAPEIFFQLDTVELNAARIEELLRRANKKKKQMEKDV